MQIAGCAGLMIGRGALKRPWVFRDIARALAGEPPCLPPTPDEVRDWAEAQLERMKDLYGEKPAILLFRKWIPQYAPALKLNRPDMVALLQLTDPAEFHREFRLLSGGGPPENKLGLDDFAGLDTGCANRQTGMGAVDIHPDFLDIWTE